MPLVAQGWTLNYEMLFYGMFALTLLLPRRLQLPCLTVSVFALVAAGFIFHPVQPALYTWTRAFSLEFLAGAWIGHIWQRNGRLWPLLLAAMSVGFLFAVLPAPSQAPARVAGACIVTAMLLGVLILERRGEGIGRFRLPLILGDASYSIYLWQGFALMAAHSLATHVAFVAKLQGAIFSIMAIAGGVAAYYLVERPLLRALRRARRYRRGVPIPAGI
ncbi:MAG: acyltransferase [Alphaproteobacteria bacterium]|nr:MAG: acyltransferase [Alphaproteobacteria bacterium]